MRRPVFLLWLLRSGVSCIVSRRLYRCGDVASPLRGVGGGRAPAPSGISHCSSVARFACSPHHFSRCGYRGDGNGSPRSVLHTCARSPSQPKNRGLAWAASLSLNIDLYLVVKWKRAELECCTDVRGSSSFWKKHDDYTDESAPTH